MIPEEQAKLYNILGQRIRNARKEKGFTQISFANRLSISRTSLVNIEKARQRPPFHLLWNMALILEIDIIEILPNKEDFQQEEQEKLLERATLQAKGNKKTEKAIQNFIQDTLTSL